MKTERRHELQTNELADWIGVHAARVKPYLKTIIGISVLAIAALFAMAMMRGQRQGQLEAAWTEYFALAQLQDLTGLRELASKNQGTEPAAWAMQSVGDIESATGATNLLIDRNDAGKHLRDAQEAYTEAINGSKEPILLQRAHMGLAQVHESLGAFDNAKSEYDLIANTWPDSAIAKEALDRKRFLETPSTAKFAAWFAQQEPPKREAIDEVLQGGAGIQPPAPSDDLPDIPELSLPSADELERPAELEIAPPPAVEDPAKGDPANSDPAIGDGGDFEATEEADPAATETGPEVDPES